MVKIVYDQNLLKFMSVFESVAHARLRDALLEKISEQELLVFVVESGEIAKAIGARGSNVHRLEDIIKKKIKIVEWADDLPAFVQNLIYPAKASSIVVEDKKIMITPIDSKSRGMVIGRGGVMLRFYERIVSRYVVCEEIKVLG